MENSKPISSTAMTYGLYLGLASIVFTLVIYFAGLFGEQWVSWLSYPISIALIVLAMIHYRDKVNGGYMAYGKGVGLGTLTAIVGGVISSIFAFILFKFIDPSLVEQIVSKAMEDAMSKQQLGEEQLAMVEKMTRMFVNPIAMFVSGIVFSAIGGVIISLIVSAIVKKNPPVFGEE